MNYLEQATPEKLELLAKVDPNRILQDNRIPQDLKWDLIAQIYTAQAFLKQKQGVDIGDILNQLPDDHPVAAKVKTYYDQYKERFIPKPPTTMTPEEAYQVAEEITAPIPTPTETTPQVAQPIDTTLRQRFLQSPKEVFVTYEDLLKLQKGEVPEKPLITVETLQKQFPEFIKPVEMYPTRPATEEEAKKISEKIKETSMKRVAIKVPKDRIEQYKAGFWWTLADYFDPILGEARRNKQVMEKLYPELKQDPLYKAQTVAGDVAGMAGRLVLLMAGLNNGIVPSTLVSRGLSPTRMVRLFKNPEVARILTNVINNAADMVALGKAFRLSEYAKVYDTLPEEAQKEFITKELTRNTALDAAFGAINGLILSSPALRFTQETVKEQVRLGKTLRLPEIAEIETRLPHYLGSFITGYAYAKGLGLDDKQATQFGLLNFGLTYFGLKQQPKLRRDFARRYLAKVLREQKPELSMQDALQIADDLMKTAGEQIWKQYTIRYPRPTKAGQSLDQYIRLETRNLAEFLSDPNVQTELYKRIANKFVHIKEFRQAINDAVQTALQTTQAQEVQTITPSETPAPEVQPAPIETSTPTVPTEAPAPVSTSTPTTPISSAVVQNFTNLLSQYKEFIPENKQQVYQKTIERASAGDEEALAHIEDATGTYFREVRNGEGEIDYVGNNKLLDEALKHPDIKTVGMVDMNGLKYINDNYNHNVGDEYLYQFVQLAKSIPDVYVFRTGGDEFVIASTKYSPEELKSMLDQDTEVVLPDGKTISVSFTAFIMPVEGKGKEALSHADELINLYKNKFRTRGKLVPKLVVGIGDLTKLNKIVNIINRSNIDNLQQNLEAELYGREGRIYEGRVGEREGGGVPTVPREPEAGVNIREEGQSRIRRQQRGKRKTTGVSQRRRVTIRNLSIAQIRQIEDARYQLVRADQTKKVFTFEVENPEEFKKFVKQVKQGKKLSQGIYKGQKYDLPAGYELKEPNLKYDNELQRYLWRPQKGDFVYYPDTGKIYEYIEWIGNPIGYPLSMDGYAKIRDMQTGKVAVVNNICVREGIPLRPVQTTVQISQPTRVTQIGLSPKQIQTLQNQGFKLIEARGNEAVFEVEDIDKFNKAVRQLITKQVKEAKKPKPQIKKQPDFALHLHDILKGLNIDKIVITNNGNVVKFELTGHQAKKGYRLIADYFETAKVGGIYPTSQKEGLHYSYDDIKQVWGELPKGRHEFKLEELKRAYEILNGKEDVVQTIKDIDPTFRPGRLDAEATRELFRRIMQAPAEVKASLIMRLHREAGVDVKKGEDELRKILEDYPIGVEEVLNVVFMDWDEITEYFKEKGAPQRFGKRDNVEELQHIKEQLKESRRQQRNLQTRLQNLQPNTAEYIEMQRQISDLATEIQRLKDEAKQHKGKWATSAQKRMIDAILQNGKYDTEQVRQWLKEFLGEDWEVVKASRDNDTRLTEAEAIAILASLKNPLQAKSRRIGIHPLFANYLFSQNWDKPYIGKTHSLFNSAPLYYTPFWMMTASESSYEFLLDKFWKDVEALEKKYAVLDITTRFSMYPPVIRELMERRYQLNIWKKFDFRWAGNKVEIIPPNEEVLRQLPHGVLIPFVLQGALPESVLDKGDPKLDRLAHECVRDLRKLYEKYAELLKKRLKIPDSYFQTNYYHRINRPKDTEKLLKNDYPSIYQLYKRFPENTALTVGILQEARNIPGFDLSIIRSTKHYLLSVARAIAYAHATPFIVGTAKMGGVWDSKRSELLKLYLITNILGRDVGREELQKLFGGYDIGAIFNGLRTLYYDFALLLNWRPIVKNIFQEFLHQSIVGSKYYIEGWANARKWYKADPKFKQLMRIGAVEERGLYELPTMPSHFRRWVNVISGKIKFTPFQAWKGVDLWKNRMGCVASAYAYGKAHGWSEAEIHRFSMQLLAITQWLYLISASPMWRYTRVGSIVHKFTAFVKWPMAFTFDHIFFLLRKKLYGALIYEILIGMMIAFIGWLLGVNIKQHVMPWFANLVDKVRRGQVPTWVHQLVKFAHDWTALLYYGTTLQWDKADRQWDKLVANYWDIPTLVQPVKFIRALYKSSYLVEVYGDDIPWWHWLINIFVPVRSIEERGERIREKRWYDNEYRSTLRLVRRHLYKAFRAKDKEKSKQEFGKAFEIYSKFFYNPKVKKWAMKNWFLVGDVYGWDGSINKNAIWRRFVNYVSTYEQNMYKSKLQKAYQTGIGHTPFTDWYIEQVEQGKDPTPPSLLEQFKKFIAK